MKKFIKTNAEYNISGKAFLQFPATDKKLLVRRVTIVLFVILVSFGRFSEVKAQTNTIEIPSWGKVVMLGDDCHLTFGNQPAVSGTTVGGYGVVGMTYYHDYFMIKKMVSAYAPITIDINNNVGIGHMFNMNSNNKLNINGNINTNGNIYALGTIISSDSRHKRNIKPISNLDNLFKVNSVQYNSSSEALKSQLDIFKSEYANKLPEESFNLAVSDYESKIVERDSDTRTYFGFIAQELREVYPDLVYEDEEGFLSVNYTGMIPVLVDAIKELKSEINELKGGFVKPNSAELISSAKLYQNNPNPFTVNTEIKFYIPENAINAAICIYDMTGKQEIKLDNLGRGYSSVTLHGSLLSPGMYMYSLLIDGKEIDTKRMILTDN